MRVEYVSLRARRRPHFIRSHLTKSGLRQSVTSTLCLIARLQEFMQTSSAAALRRHTKCCRQHSPRRYHLTIIKNLWMLERVFEMELWERETLKAEYKMVIWIWNRYYFLWFNKIRLSCFKTLLLNAKRLVKYKWYLRSEQLPKVLGQAARTAGRKC